MNKTTSIVLVLLLAIVLIGLGPVLTLLSVNLLFGLNITINFWSWLACAWLCLLINGARVKSK